MLAASETHVAEKATWRQRLVRSSCSCGLILVISTANFSASTTTTHAITNLPSKRYCPHALRSTCVLRAGRQTSAGKSRLHAPAKGIRDQSSEGGALRRMNCVREPKSEAGVEASAFLTSSFQLPRWAAAISRWRVPWAVASGPLGRSETSRACYLTQVEIPFLPARR